MVKTLAALTLCACGLAAAPPTRKPKLVVALTVDQLRFDYLHRFRADYKDGFVRLLQNGAVFTNAHHDHFPTVTAVGHAVLLSGAPPSVSGIVGNEWFDRESGRQVTSVSDPAHKLLGGGARAAASPHRLLVSTVADELKMAGRESRSVGISLKDRGAILPLGRMGDAAYWFDDASGNFVSSTYYFADLPGWVKDFNNSRPADRYLGREWLPLTGGPALVKMATQPGRPFYSSLERSPFGNELLVEFAERAVGAEQLGRHSGTDILALSLSCNDYVGHAKGPDSIEVRDISIHTDRLLGRFFAFLDQRLGLDNVLIVLSSDHGVAPLPELMQQRKMPGGRIPAKVVLGAVEKRLTELYGEGRWIAGNSGPAAYLNYDLIRQKNLKLAEVQEAAAEAIRAIPHIARVYTREQLSRGLIPEDDIGRRLTHGFHPVRAADLFVVSEPYYLFEERGTSHGTPYNYDSHVPIIFMGQGVRPGTYSARVTMNDIAPTLAEMLEVETPSGASGRVLVEMLSTH